MSNNVTIVEMGPRDGLQNEALFVSTKDKIELVNLLSACGFERIEVTSFVSPKWVPQLADAHDVMRAISRRPGTRYTALVPNRQGLEAAISASVDEIAVFASASEGFSWKNINCSVEESLLRFDPVLREAKARGLPVRGYVSCIMQCPYDGAVSPSKVSFVVKSLLERGCFEVSLGDTLGAATPEQSDRLMDNLLKVASSDRLAGHFHDTSGRALENIDVFLARGIRVFDASIAGLGGCPYAPGAKGNVSTEAVIDHLAQGGFSTSLDRRKIAVAAHYVRQLEVAR